jgi:hypothetical protein
MRGMQNVKYYLGLIWLTALMACSKTPNVTPPPPVVVPASFTFNALKVNGLNNGFNYVNINKTPVIKISFSAPLDHSTVNSGITFRSKAGSVITYSATYENNDSTVVITPAALDAITQYTLSVSTSLKSTKSANLQSAIDVQLTTAIDPSDKFPVITDDQLLDLVQKQTFKYFWDNGNCYGG